MCIEAEVAAKWWADQLRGKPVHQSGNPILAAMHADSDAVKRSMEATDAIDKGMELLRKRRPDFTAESIDRFEKNLTELITEQFCRNETWELAKSDPLRGAIMRTLSVDYGLCSELQDVFQSTFGVKGSAGYFPIKTMMWIDPNCVKVRRGYGAKTKILYSETRPANDG